MTKSTWPVVFWAGAAVGQFGAIHPEWSYPWRPTAYLGVLLLVALGLLVVRAASTLTMTPAMKVAAYVAGALVVAHQLGTIAHVTSLSRTGSILLYGTALVMAVWRRSTRTPAGGPLLIASGIGIRRLRALLATLPGDTIAIYRTHEETPELVELGITLIVGDEHDPYAKEQISASGLHRLVPDIGDRQVLLVGPRPFRKYVKGALARLAVPREHVFKARQRA